MINNLLNWSCNCCIYVPPMYQLIVTQNNIHTFNLLANVIYFVCLFLEILCTGNYVWEGIRLHRTNQCCYACLWKTQVYLGLPAWQGQYQESRHVTVIEQWGSVWICVMGPQRPLWGQRSCHSWVLNALSHNLAGDGWWSVCVFESVTNAPALNIFVWRWVCQQLVCVGMRKWFSVFIGHVSLIC